MKIVYTKQNAADGKIYQHNLETHRMIEIRDGDVFISGVENSSSIILKLNEIKTLVIFDQRYLDYMQSATFPDGRAYQE